MAASSFHSLHQLPSIKLQATKKRVFHVKAEKSSTLLVTEKQKNMVHGQEKMQIGSKTVVFIVEHLRKLPLKILKPPDSDLKISRRLQAEIIIDQAIINCRFFTLIAVVGSLVGSILCFVEGCFLTLGSYIEDFLIISQRLDNGRMVQMIIEAIDMFLVGTAMLTFGMGLYSMFIGSKRSTERSNFFGRFHPKQLSAGSKMNSISHAKTRLGHAIVMLLQVGLVEKFKKVPLMTGIDLACFAGAILFSSASMFLLSQLYCSSKKGATNEGNNRFHPFIQIVVAILFIQKPKSHGRMEKPI